jgi:hypothetical protein
MENGVNDLHLDDGGGKRIALRVTTPSSDEIAIKM